MKLTSAIFFFLLTLFTFAHSASKDTITISMPQEGYGSSRDIVKYILTDIYKSAGYTPVFLAHPLKRSIHEVNIGRVMAELARIDSIDQYYENIVKIPVPVYYINIVIFSKTKSLKTIDDIQNKRIAITRGSIGAEMIIKDYASTIEHVNSPEALFTMLYLDRVDAVAYSKIDGLIDTKHLGFQNIIHPNSFSLHTTNLFHYINKKHKEVIAKITHFIKEMETSGELLKLIDRAEKEVLYKEKINY